MDFARRQLEKYGWTSGKGLGRNENGIKEALKPHMKRSTTGMGHDASTEFTNHWWSNLYDKASGNIQVLTSDSGLNDKISTKDPDAVEITSRTWRIGKKKLKKKKKTNKNPADECENVEEKSYMDHFVKKAILTSGGAKTENINSNSGCSEDEIELPMRTKQMTDEELFQACGGLTAHKGSRHGLRASGKLSRIQEQESKLLQLPQYSGYSHAKNSIENNADIHQHNDKTISKKSKKKSKNIPGEENTEELDKKMAKKAKKRKQKEEEMFERYDSIENGNLQDSGLEVSTDTKKKRKDSKKKQRCEAVEDWKDEKEDTGIHLEETLNSDTETLIEKKTKPKKKKFKL